MATAAQMAAPRLAPPLATQRDEGMPKTSAKMLMNRSLAAPPPETAIASSVMPSSSHMASTLFFMVRAMASRIER